MYAPSLVYNPWDEINRFITGVSYDLVEEYLSDILHDNMNTSDLMVQVEESRVRSESGSSKGMFKIHDRYIFKKWFSNKFPQKFHKARDNRVSNGKSEKV